MTTDEASQILDLPSTATADEVEARYNELRTKLEEKIAKAPTPGLREKYRRSLDELTHASEALIEGTATANLLVLERSSSTSKANADLPPTTKERPVDVGRGGSPPKHHRKSGYEFLIVTLIALLVLGGGAWWVLETRKAHEERVRVEAEAQERAERLAAEQLAAEKAEAERIDLLAVSIRTALAEFRVEWDAVEQQQRGEERRLAELKSDLRNNRDLSPQRVAELSELEKAQTRYVEWLSGHLAKHPSKFSRSRIEELLAARLVDSAALELPELRRQQQVLESDIIARRNEIFAIEGSLFISSEPSNLEWTLVDAFGRKRAGVTPSTVEGLAPGAATVTILRTRFNPVVNTVHIRSRETASTSARFDFGRVEIDSDPQGLVWELTDASGEIMDGTTPGTAEMVAPGQATLEIVRPGFLPVVGTLEVVAGASVSVSAEVHSQGLQVVTNRPEADIWLNGEWAGYSSGMIEGWPPGIYKLEARAPGAFPAVKTIEIKAENTLLSQTLNLTDLNGTWMVESPASNVGEIWNIIHRPDGVVTGSVRDRGHHVSSPPLAHIKYERTEGDRIILSGMASVVFRNRCLEAYDQGWLQSVKIVFDTKNDTLTYSIRGHYTHCDGVELGDWLSFVVRRIR